MKERKPMQPPPRERILAAAEELFYREGIRGVGVEAIAVRAETTKMALYRHFESKDALVAEWLRGVAVGEEAIFDRLAAEHAEDAHARLWAWVRLVADRLVNCTGRGCALVNSLAELPDPEHPALRVIEAHKAARLERLEAWCTQAGLSEPTLVAGQLFLMVEGSLTSARSLGPRNTRERLLRIAQGLLGDERPPARRRR